MVINTESSDIAEFYKEFPDAIFVPVEDFKKYIGDVLPTPVLPPFVVVGEAILLSFRLLRLLAEGLRFHYQKQRLTSDEGGSWIVKLEPWNPPKGDIMNHGIRMPGSYGSKQ